MDRDCYLIYWIKSVKGWVAGAPQAAKPFLGFLPEQTASKVKMGSVTNAQCLFSRFFLGKYH